MRKLAFVMAMLASPAAATGLSIEIQSGETVLGTVEVDLFEADAPKHVKQISTLAAEGAYDNVVFHRVIQGFMAQTGDVEHGKLGADMRRAGTGASHLPNIDAEFGSISFERGVVGMARSRSPNSANAQFFIMFAPAPHLNGQYTVVGEVTSGMDVVDTIKLGLGANGAVLGAPDFMKSVTVTE